MKSDQSTSPASSGGAETVTLSGAVSEAGGPQFDEITCQLSFRSSTSVKPVADPNSAISEIQEVVKEQSACVPDSLASKDQVAFHQECIRLQVKAGKLDRIIFHVEGIHRAQRHETVPDSDTSTASISCQSFREAI